MHIKSYILHNIFNTLSLSLSTEGVVEKHDFRGIQQKIRQNSDFAIKRDSNPLPHGDIAVYRVSITRVQHTYV
jgi:hypothetical protein